MMRKQTFQLELLTNVILTQDSATEGGHQTLEYIPGANFLGWAAGQLYETLAEQSANDAFTVFHSSKVRFGNALPILSPNHMTYPVPLAFHKEKLTGQWANLVHPDAEQLKQPKQLRKGFIDAANNYIEYLPKRSRAQVSLAKRHLSRRGVQPKSQDNQLFVYQSLNAGLLFRWTLSADDDVSDELFAQLISVFEGSKVRLGRSRGVEYGEALVTACKTPESPEPFAHSDNTVSLLLMSDMALRDEETGQPTLLPTPKALGLPQAMTLRWDKSFVQTRRFTPFNRHRKRPDLEIQVLSAGSVLTFTHDGSVSLEELQNTLQSGVGAYRERGLGQVAVNPPCLRQVEPTYSPLLSDVTELDAAVQTPDDPLYAYVEHLETMAEQEKEIFEKSREWALALWPYADKPKGPGRAQWGMLRQVAAQASNGTDLWERLFNEEEGLLHEGVRAHAWYVASNGVKAVDIFQELVDAFAPKGNDERLPWLIERTAARVLHLMGRDTEGDIQ